MALIESGSDVNYSAAPIQLGSDSAGKHLRHCSEFFECFLDGLETRGVDYASQKRDRAVGRDRLLGMLRTAEVVERLDALFINPDEKHEGRRALSPAFHRKDRAAHIAPSNVEGCGRERPDMRGPQRPRIK